MWEGDGPGQVVRTGWLKLAPEGCGLGWPGPQGGEGGKPGVCTAHSTSPQPASHPCPAQTELRECDYNKFMSVLDSDKDGEVDFVEYVRSLACLCTYCHEYFKDCPPEPPCSQ